MISLFLLTLVVIVLGVLALLLKRKSKFFKPCLVILAVVGVGFLIYMFNPVKMGLVGLSSYGFPGPYWEAAERTDDWMVKNGNSGSISLSSKNIDSNEDADISARIFFAIDTVYVRPRVTVNVERFSSLGDSDEYSILFQEGKKSFFATAEYIYPEFPEIDKAHNEAMEYFDHKRSFFELSEKAIEKVFEILAIANNSRLDIYGKDALKIVRLFRKAEGNVKMMIVGEDGETATFEFDITGFKEAYGTFFWFVKSYEENSFPEIEMPVFQEICRKLGIYF